MMAKSKRGLSWETFENHCIRLTLAKSLKDLEFSCATLAKALK